MVYLSMNSPKIACMRFFSPIRIGVPVKPIEPRWAIHAVLVDHREGVALGVSPVDVLDGLVTTPVSVRQTLHRAWLPAARP